MLFLVHFSASQNASLSCDELDALLSMCGIKPRDAYERLPDNQDLEADPFVVVSLPSLDIAKRIAARAALVRAMTELWSVHDCHTLHEAVASVTSAESPAGSRLRELLPDDTVTWRLVVDGFRASLTMPEQEATRQHFRAGLPWRGRVRVKDAAVTVRVLIDFESHKRPLYAAGDKGGSSAGAASDSADSSAAGAAVIGFAASAFVPDTYTPTVLLRPNSEAVAAAAALPGIEDEACCSACEFGCGGSAAAAVCGAGGAGAGAADGAAAAFVSPRGFGLMVRQRSRRVFVGLDVGPTARTLLLDRLSLKKRPYLGPTTLDPELGLAMANLARVKPGHIVLDPFVGTGSILASAAALTGCTVLGTDIDFKILAGKGGKDVFTNFAHYGLAPPELLYADNATAPVTDRPIIDAIIADPPYGVRAGARRGGPAGTGLAAAAATAAAVGGAGAGAAAATPAAAAADDSAAAVAVAAAVEPTPPAASADARGAEAAAAGSTAGAAASAPPVSKTTGQAYNPRVWATRVYEEVDVMADLLDRAARMLVPGGRLVYLYPTLREGHSLEKLPHHPCLAVESDSEETLTLLLCRRIVTMVKVVPYDAAAAARGEYAAAARAAAVRAGTLSVGLRDRMGAAYDGWFASHRNDFGGAESVAQLRVGKLKKSDDASAAGGAAAAAGGAGAVAADASAEPSLDEAAKIEARAARERIRAEGAAAGLSKRKTRLVTRKLAVQLRREEKHERGTAGSVVSEGTGTSGAAGGAVDADEAEAGASGRE